jgi:hypothetical protein
MKRVYEKFVSIGAVVTNPSLLDPSTSSYTTLLSNDNSPNVYFLLLGLTALGCIGGIIYSLISKNYLFLIISFCCFLAILFFVGIATYVIKERASSDRWKVTVAWALFLMLAMIGIFVSFISTIFFPSPYFITIVASIILGLIAGFAILCWMPEKGVLAWFGFLSGISVDSITAPGIIKWASKVAENIVTNVVNPFLPSSAQLQLVHINLGVGLCVVILILLSLPALFK